MSNEGISRTFVDCSDDFGPTDFPNTDALSTEGTLPYFTLFVTGDDYLKVK